MGMSELKPCPFCGGEAGFQYGYFNSDVYVRCNECRACSEVRVSEKAAIAAWNRRADGWIPVSERLPNVPEKKDGKYNFNKCLVTNGKFISIAYRDMVAYPLKDYEEWIFQDICFDINDHDVTHWMPLPEPPKIGGDISG